MEFIICKYIMLMVNLQVKAAFFVSNRLFAELNMIK